MKTNLTACTGTCRLHIRPSARDSFTEYHVTATIEGTMGVAEAAEAVFSRVAAVLVDRGIQPLQEKLYGFARVRDEVMKQRNLIYRGRGLDRTMPVTWIEGAPLQGCDFVGVQIWGISPHGGEIKVTTVEDPVFGRGRLWRGSGFRMLHLPNVRGNRPDGVLPPLRVDQAHQMFTNVGHALAAHGFKYTHVVRTWIYLAKLLEWYVDMNGVRTALYRQAGLGVPGGPAFPASTGIMGRFDDEECLMDVLALDSDGPAHASATPIHRSPRQDSSFNYGSSFSRGMAIAIEQRRTLHISGTASINTAGASTYLNDPEHQALEMLMSISAILEEQGGTLQNITAATLFCKNREAWEAWERVSRLLSLPAIPKVCVLADVCRENLLVEMEAVAVV